jgi:hypothetical protein
VRFVNSRRRQVRMGCRAVLVGATRPAGDINSMKPVQIGLWAVGAAMCAISIGFLFDDIGRGGHQPPIGEAPSRSAPAQELVALVTPESPQPDQLNVLDPVAQDSSHAIVPDTPPVTAPSPPAEATAPSADLPTSQATAPSPEPAVKEASPPIFGTCQSQWRPIRHNAQGRACDNNFGGNHT